MVFSVFTMNQYIPAFIFLLLLSMQDEIPSDMSKCVPTQSDTMWDGSSSVFWLSYSKWLLWVYKITMGRRVRGWDDRLIVQWDGRFILYPCYLTACLELIPHYLPSNGQCFHHHISKTPIFYSLWLTTFYSVRLGDDCWYLVESSKAIVWVIITVGTGSFVNHRNTPILISHCLKQAAFITSIKSR